jgi:predicted helicase
MFFMLNRDLIIEEEYQKGFSINELFLVNGVGLTTAHDEFVINNSKEDLLKSFQDFKNSERNSSLLHKKFKVKEKEGWNILNGYDNIKNENNLIRYIEPITYRPFDNRFIFYEDKLVWRTVRKVMQHFLNGENLGLISARSNKSGSCDHFFISKYMMETKCGERTTQSAIFPLFLYPEISSQQKLEEKSSRVSNLNNKIIKQISSNLELNFLDEINTSKDIFSPMDILDYIYSVMYNPTYRKKYEVFLKSDFPVIPYPKHKETFWELVKLGGEIRQIHLLESAVVDNFITLYPVKGDNIVNKKANFEDGKVWINNNQYFENVPQVAWEFYIGGYQPAQKWLKDRKDRVLSEEDLNHYQKIIVALTETDRIMKEIDTIEIE